MSDYLDKRSRYYEQTLFAKKSIAVDFSTNYLDAAIVETITTKLSYCPLLLCEAQEILPSITDINTSGSTSIVYKVIFGQECLAVKIRKDKMHSAFFKNEIEKRCNENIKMLPEMFFASEKNGVIISKWIEGKTLKNIDTRYVHISLEKILSLTADMIKEGYYDDDFTPSNIIYTKECAKVIDAGTLFRCNTKQLNPYCDGLSMQNMFSRLLYRNVMVYLIRLGRIGCEDTSFKIYKDFMPKFIDALKSIGELLSSNHLVSFWNNYRDAYEQNILSSFIRDKYLCHMYILSENLADNYYDNHTTTRLKELIMLLENNYDSLSSNEHLIFEDINFDKKDCLLKYKAILEDVCKFK